MTTNQILTAFKLFNSAEHTPKIGVRKRVLFGKWYMARYYPNISDPWITDVKTSNESLMRLLFDKKYNGDSI